MPDYTIFPLDQLKIIFEDPANSDDERKLVLSALQKRAEQIDPTNICRMSKEKEVVFYAEWEEALIPGHIYSPAGLEEYRISQSCEYHFDLWMDDGE